MENEGKNPLWLPKGSIRALIAIAIVGAGIAQVMLAPGGNGDAQVGVGLILAGGAAYGVMRQTSP